MTKEERKEYDREYYIKNKERKKKARKAYYYNNPEKCLNQSREYKLKNSEKVKEYLKWYDKECRDKDKIALKQRNYLSKSTNAKVSTYLRTRIWSVLKGKTKHGSLLELTGMPTEHLISYLESKFQGGMTWDNYGRGGWHIDHIRPCASFDLSDPEQQKLCFHYSNLQPLWEQDNLSKGSKV